MTETTVLTTAQPAEVAERMPTAVLYLRVSTKEQAERDGDPEGYSIPAQREACLRRASTLEAVVVEEFVDRGESARSADRPELQRLLAHVKSNHVDYVIVHKVDRLARNRADDVQITLAIKTAGATLVSCSENIDETPSGALLHGIMSSIAEFYSRNLANEVIKGCVQKAKTGGTVGKAPLGYLNVRKNENGREVRSVETDSVRGPLMKWAFETYATTQRIDRLARYFEVSEPAMATRLRQNGLLDPTPRCEPPSQRNRQRRASAAWDYLREATPLLHTAPVTDVAE